MESIKYQRDPYIDFLRAFGLVLLVIAHTFAPYWLKTIRTFDVPLMVFISAICYHHSNKGYVVYVVKRFKRIYIPVFTFLTIFFILTLPPSIIFNKWLWDINKVLGSYLLLNEPSIGYVWIMRVFLICAIVMPIIYCAIFKFKFIHILTTIIGIYIIQDLLVYYMTDQVNNVVWNEIVLYTIGYSIFIILGLAIKKFSNLQMLLFIIISVGLICTELRINNVVVFNPQLTKYPPHSIYISYGMAACVFAWLCKNYIHVIPNRFITYLSENSMWIYLWHIIFAYAIYPVSSISNLWFGRFLFVLIGGLLANFFFQKLIKKLPVQLYLLIKG